MNISNVYIYFFFIFFFNFFYFIGGVSLIFLQSEYGIVRLWDKVAPLLGNTPISVHSSGSHGLPVYGKIRKM